MAVAARFVFVHSGIASPRSHGRDLVVRVERYSRAIRDVQTTTWYPEGVTLGRGWRTATGNAPKRDNLDDPNFRRYLKSYLLLRVLIGAIGLSLPIMTYAGTALLPGGRWSSLRGSLSGYYYTGMREYFTCSLAVTGLFLITYKAFKRELESIITLIAGFAVLLVAFFPTDPPTKKDVPNAIQNAFGVNPVKYVHYTSAIIFILLLAVISHFFAGREGKREPRANHRSPQFWKWLHNGCAAAILVAGAFLVARKVFHLPCGSWVNAHDVWLTEIVAVAAFSTSWLFKGAEITQV
jgi:hypothetical protein